MEADMRMIATALALLLISNVTASAQTAPVRVPDLSGIWGFGIGVSLGPGEDTGPSKSGLPDDAAPYKPETRAKLMAERPPMGPRTTFDNPTDPYIKYCDPNGVPRVWTRPAKFRFIQLPDVVYILYEFNATWRVIWMNQKDHGEDVDASWYGHSIGRYEGDSLVVDSIGFNDKAWLDSTGRPISDQLHLTERFRRVNPNTLEISLTIDDPGAYTRPWTYTKNVTLKNTPFGRYMFTCSITENLEFEEAIPKPAIK
jgi:hypothetical protein